METLSAMPTSQPQRAVISGTGHFACGITRVLYVDDDAVQQRISANALQSLACKVDQAQNGLEAWDLLQKKQFDLIITDNEMPYLTGLQLVNRLRLHGSDLPVILASSSADQLVPAQLASLRLSARLQKPFSPTDLIRAVQPIILSALSTPTKKNTRPLTTISFLRDLSPYQHWGINE